MSLSVAMANIYAGYSYKLQHVKRYKYQYIQIDLKIHDIIRYGIVFQDM